MVNAGDTSWILTATALVLFMTMPGLALFYAGLVRSKNILSVLMHCAAVCCLASVTWLAVATGLPFQVMVLMLGIYQIISSRCIA